MTKFKDLIEKKKCNKKKKKEQKPKKLEESKDMISDLRDTFEEYISDMRDDVYNITAGELDSTAETLFNKLSEYNFDDAIYAAKVGDVREFEKIFKDFIDYGFGDYDEDEAEEMEEFCDNCLYYSSEIIDVALAKSFDSSEVMNLIDDFEKRLQKVL